MRVCVCVRVWVHLAQQARVRAATLIQAPGVCMRVCVCVRVCTHMCVNASRPAGQDPCSHPDPCPRCACVCVCVCIYVHLAQQARVRAATMIQALGVRDGVCV